MGDVLIRQGKSPVRIEKLESHEQHCVVYNFHVEGLQNYAVGEQRILVHNNCTNKIEVTHKIPRDKLKYKPKERGRAPIGEDGHPVELHHNDQDLGNASTRSELTRTDHRGKGNFKKNHTNTGKSSSKVDRAESSQMHRHWWEAEFDAGEFDHLPPIPE